MEGGKNIIWSRSAIITNLISSRCTQIRHSVHTFFSSCSNSINKISIGGYLRCRLILHRHGVGSGGRAVVSALTYLNSYRISGGIASVWNIAQGNLITGTADSQSGVTTTPVVTEVRIIITFQCGRSGQRSAASIRTKINHVSDGHTRQWIYVNSHTGLCRATHTVSSGHRVGGGTGRGGGHRGHVGGAKAGVGTPSITDVATVA